VVKTRAAVLWEVGKQWSVEEIELDPPRHGEVLVRMTASGLCHTDDHLVTGDFPMGLPIIGGHEGGGVVEEVGPGVTSLAPGDQVVFQFVPSCGRCAPCASGFQNLCDRGMHLSEGWQLSDGTARHHAGGTDLALMCLLGTFAERTVVHEDSCIKVDADVPLDKACLLACGVLTGWGSAVYGAEVRPGDDVAVVGVGGVGINAVQGAKLAGAHRIFAIDPVPFKRDKAREFGATHTAASLEEAQALVADETWGRMCHKVIMTMGVGRGELIAPALAITAKRGRVVVTNVHPAADMDVKMSMIDLTMLEKQLVGCLLGSAKARADVPHLIGLYRDGQLKLDELITRTYDLDDINVGYDDMREGRNLRGVLHF
jgi:NDMA-dependent alcohol dehydrogenase